MLMPCCYPPAPSCLAGAALQALPQLAAVGTARAVCPDRLLCRAQPEGCGAGLLVQESKEEGGGQSKAWERTWEIWERKYKMGRNCLFSISISHPGRTLVF